MADEEVVVSLTYDARASAQRAVDDANKVIASLNNIAVKANQVSESAEKSNKSFSGLNRLVNKIASDFEPWSKSLRAATAEANNLDIKIKSLADSQSRSKENDNLLERSLALRVQLTKRIEELGAASLVAASAQDKLNSTGLIDSFAKIINVVKGASVSIEAHTQAVNLFKSKIDTTIGSLSSFANAQQMLANSANRMTSGWNEATGLMVRLTEKFNPGAVAAQGLTSAMIELNTAHKLGIVGGEQYILLQKKIADSFDLEKIKALEAANADEKLTQARIANSQRRIEVEEREIRAALNRFQAMVGGARADQVAQDSQSFFNQRTGVERAVNPTPINAGNSMLGQIGDRQEAEIEDVRRAQERLAKQTKDTADRFDYLTAKFNQDATAAKNYRQTIKELNELMATGTLNYTNYNAQANRAIDVYNRSTVEGQKSAQANKVISSSIHEVGLNTRVAQYAMTNFSFQINDVVSGLAMGQQPFRIFAQQAGQFVQIFQQIGRENIGQFFKDMRTNVTDLGSTIGRWLITPVGAAVTALGTLVIGAGFVISEVLSAETRIRSFGVILRTMGTDSLVSAKALDETVRKLRDTGSAAKDANAAVQAIARTPGINPARRDDIADTARNISAARGISFADAASGLSNAIAGGADELTKYAQSLGVRVNPEEQKAIDRTILLRDKVEQLRITYLAIVRVMKGEFAESLTKTQELVNALSTKWNELLHALGQTSWFQTALKGLTELGDILTALTKGELKIAPMTIHLKFGSWDFGDMGKQFGEHLRSYFPSEMRTPEEKSRYSPYPSQRPGGGRGVFTTSLPGMDAGVLGEPGSVATVLPTLKSELSRYDIGGLKIDTDSLQKLAQIIAEGSKALPEGYRVRAISTYRPGAIIEGTDTPSEHGFKRAIDNEIIDPQGRIVPGAMGRGGPLYQQLDKAVETAAAKLAPDIAIAIGSRFTRKPDAGHYSLGGPEAVSQAVREGRPGGLTIDTGAGKNILTEQTRDIKLQETALGLVNRELVRRQAIISATAEAQNKFKEATDVSEGQKAQYILEQENLALKQFDDQLNKNIKTEDIRIKGLQDTARATMDSSAAAVHAKAVAEADNRVRSEGIDFNVAYRQAIATTAAEAVRGAAEQVSSQVPVITGLQKQAEALKISELAARNVRIDNEANIIVQQAVNAGVKEEVNILKEKARAQILDREASQFSMETTRFVRQQTDSQQVLQLQIQMQGQTTEEINRQVAGLTEKLRLERESPGLAESEKNARLGALDATQRQVIALGNATREQQRLESGIRGIADTIGNTLLTSMENVFSGKKVESWRETVSKTLTSLGKQLLDFTLIKPLMGTALGALGFGNLSQQFGTFGSSLFGGSGSNQTGVGVYGSTSGSGSSGIKQIGDMAGAGKSIFDLFGSGASNAATDAPGFLSSAFSGSEFLFGTGLDFGGGGAAMGVADVLGGTVAAEGTSGLLGGLGMAGIGSALPFIGAGVGILSMVLPMLFAKKPSNFASGGNLSLGSGTISATASEGNAQNTQTSNAILKGISQFSQQLIQMTGGRLAGDLNIQAGTRDGIKIAGSIGNADNKLGTIVSTEGVKFGSVEEAINTVNLALVRHVENVSETMDKVLSRVTDLSQLERAVQFAKLYDNLKNAFDSAFSQVEPNKIGPYEQALNEIKIKFEELTAAANEFGLSLDPINAGLKEANKRLVADFNKNISDAILGITDPIKILIQTEKENGQARVKDAQAIGASMVEVNRLNALALDKIWESQTQNLTELAESLRTGGLSGLTIGGQLSAANDNFRQSLNLVRGGNLNEIENLAANAGTAFGLSQQAYGNAPQTARLRTEILDAIDSAIKITRVAVTVVPVVTPSPSVTATATATTVAAPVVSTPVADVITNNVVPNAITIEQFANLFSSEGDASGSLSTPVGNILVGELGPEWMLSAANKNHALNLGSWTQVGRNGAEIINQPGGAVILPFPMTPSDVINRSFAEGTGTTGFISEPKWMRQNNEGGGSQFSGQNSIKFGEMISELRMLRNEVQMLREENTRVMVGVGQDTGERLEKVRGELRKKPLLENVRARA